MVSSAEGDDTLVIAPESTIERSCTSDTRRVVLVFASTRATAPTPWLPISPQLLGTPPGLWVTTRENMGPLTCRDATCAQVPQPVDSVMSGAGGGIGKDAHPWLPQ